MSFNFRLNQMNAGNRYNSNPNSKKKVKKIDRVAPVDEDKFAIVLRPTSVLEPMVVSRLLDDITGPGASDMLLEDILTLNNYCVSWAVFLAAAAHLLDFLCIKRLSIISNFSSICLA